MSEPSRRRAGLRVAIVVAVGLAAACSSEPPTAPFGNSSSPAPQVSQPFGVTFAPAGMVGGGASTGTATVTLPAPAGGLVLTLSSSDPAATAPASVTVAAGSRSVDFPVTSQSVTVDTTPVITASTPNGSAPGKLALWAVLPTFFWAISDPGDTLVVADYKRLTPPNAQFRAQCQDNYLNIFISDASFTSAAFSAPAGQPLRVGTYENATRWLGSPMASPSFSVFVDGRGCNILTGRFVVKEVDVTATGSVTRFWATFEQHCEARAPALRGEIRVTNPPAVPPSSVSCLR
jgi:hypothetical protein